MILIIIKHKKQNSALSLECTSTLLSVPPRIPKVKYTTL